MNKPAEALRNYEDSMAINQHLGQKRGVAASLAEIAQVQLSLGKPDAAFAAYNDALKIRRKLAPRRKRATRSSIWATFIPSAANPIRRCRCSKNRCRFSATPETKPTRRFA
jgi:tetratricopeptide (TPR) repeat protein